MGFTLRFEQKGIKLWGIIHWWFIVCRPLGGYVAVFLVCLIYWARKITPSMGPQRLFGRSITSLMYKENENRIYEINFALFSKPCAFLFSFTGPLSPHSFLFIHLTHPSILVKFCTVSHIVREERKAKMRKKNKQSYEDGKKKSSWLAKGWYHFAYSRVCVKETWREST